MGWRGALAVACVVGASVAGVGTAAAAPAGKRTLKTGGAIVDLAADGPRVVVGIEATARRCDRIVSWEPARDKRFSWNARSSCPPGDATSGGESLVEVGIAGKRVAWVESYRGNLQELALYSSRVGSRNRTLVTIAENGDGAKGEPTGDYLGGIKGDGPLLLYNAWSVCISYPAGWVVEPPPEPPCHVSIDGTEPAETIHAEQLLDVGSEEPIAEAGGAFRLAAVDGARIATLQPGGGVTVRTADGGTLATIPAPAGEITGVGLSGSEIGLMRSDGALELYDASSGAHEATATVGLPTTGRFTDFESGIAVVVTGNTVRLVRIADEAVARFTAPRAIVDAELEENGLSYAWNGRRAPRGRVVFLPWASVQSALG